MKNKSILILVQGILSLISGVLVSKMSIIGKIGITLIYREYSILKVWWKAALLFFSLQLIVILFLSTIQHLSTIKNTVLVAICLCMVGILGIYLTYIDFTESTHKMLNTSFHSGVYLFWLGYFITCSYFMNFKSLRKIK